MQKKIKLATFALCSSALALNSMQAMAAQAMTAAPDNGAKAAHADMLSVQQNKSIKGVVVDKVALLSSEPISRQSATEPLRAQLPIWKAISSSM